MREVVIYERKKAYEISACLVGSEMCVRAGRSSTFMGLVQTHVVFSVPGPIPGRVAPRSHCRALLALGRVIMKHRLGSLKRFLGPVSYTHLTLPSTYPLYISSRPCSLYSYNRTYQ